MQLRIKLKAPRQTKLYVRCGGKEYPLTPEKAAIVSCQEQEAFEIYSRPTSQQEVKDIWRRLPQHLLLSIRDVYSTDMRGNWPKRIRPYTMHCRGAAIASDMTVRYRPSRYDPDTQSCRPPEVQINEIGLEPEVEPDPLHAKLCLWKYFRHVCALAIDAWIVWILCWIMTGAPVLWLLLMAATAAFALYCVSQENRRFGKIRSRLPKKTQGGNTAS